MNVAIYIRVSTLEQAREGYSLAAQERALRDWCRANNHTVTKIYADEGISGKDIEHRPAMCKLLADAQMGEFDMILVWALSRLTRSVADLYDTLDILMSNNVGLRSHTEAFDTGTPTGRAMMGLLGVFAQMERDITAERVRAAMEARAAMGKRTCNEVLGYDLVGRDGFKINDREAERVRYIFDRYAEYKNLSAVAELCQLKGYTGKRGRIFRAQNIKTILTRPVYAGYNTFNGRLYKGQHPAIISVRQFNAVQDLLCRRCPEKARHLK